jgi:hypothetical protein
MMGSRRGWAAVAVAIGMTALAGCSGTGSSTAQPGAATAPAAAPEGNRASAGEVATGLKKIDQIARDMAAAGSDKARATELDGQIEPQWAAVEGTVKSNDAATYEAFEDTFAVLEKAAEDGDAAAAAKGSGTVSATVAGYLAKYPG